MICEASFVKREAPDELWKERETSESGNERRFTRYASRFPERNENAARLLKTLSSKAEPTNAPEAYPLGYVEDAF